MDPTWKKYVTHIKNPHDVYVGRPSKWGNPFRVDGSTTRLQAIRKYREWIVTQPQLIADLPELRGKTLGCWCYPMPCHAEVLAELANLE